jgi:RHS repeat-associated protein
VESGFSANSFGYTYDRAGNRLSSTQNGATTSRSYDAANQVVGWSYDAAGNLLSDGATSYAYDALSRVTSSTRAGVVTTNSYNADGTLVAQTTSGVTTRYAQDLAAPLSQVLSIGATRYVYGHERLATQSGSATSWYAGDALSSLRQTLDSTGMPRGTASYDPWGTPQGSALAPFGFTGELQDSAGLTYLRARWYTPGEGRFLARDPFEGYIEQPYSLHSYQYAYSIPTLRTDPTGQCVPEIIGKYSQYDAIGFWKIIGGLAEKDCKFIFETGQGINWADGQAYARAISDPVVQAAEALHLLFTDREVQLEVQRRYSGSTGSFNLAADIATGTLEEVYKTICDLGVGVVNDDPNSFGRGLSRIAVSLGTAIATKAGVKAIISARTSYAVASRLGYTGPKGGFTNMKPQDLQRGKPYLSLKEAMANPDVRTLFGDGGLKIRTASYIYVITRDGEIRLATYRGYHHADLVDGDNVYGAGQIWMDENGIITKISDQSGHYFPRDGSPFGSAFYGYMRRLLKNQGIDVPESVFE